MMWWYDGGTAWWAWLIMAIGMVAFWGVVLGAVVAVIRGADGRDRGPAAGPDPERILGERFARGEIDADEYQRRHATLRGEKTAA